ncbi:MAG: inositol monophosphatase [Sphingomonadaceae bacterium]|nr:inositol monophosphatase [Sphingomonadaceae bacterium]
MSALDDEIRDLLRFAAERSILPRFRNLADDEIIEKAEDDLVTVADRETEEFLTEALEKLAPGVPVVGEEAVHADPTVADRLKGPCWIIDPIDGTHNFAAGKGPFGTIIALADGGETIAGWIYDPQTQRLCHAKRGEGAFVNGEQITAQATGENPPIAAISLIFLDEEQREATKRHLAPHYRMVDIPRCAAEQYPRLALGVNDISVFKRTLAWDHATGVLWLNEAGGKAARPDGSAYRVDEHDRIGLIGAASPALFDELAERIAGLA